MSGPCRPPLRRASPPLAGLALALVFKAGAVRDESWGRRSLVPAARGERFGNASALLVSCPDGLTKEEESCTIFAAGRTLAFYDGTLNVQALLNENFAVALAVYSGIEDDSSIEEGLRSLAEGQHLTKRPGVLARVGEKAKEKWKAGISNLWRVCEIVDKANSATGGLMTKSATQALQLVAQGSLSFAAGSNVVGVALFIPNLALQFVKRENKFRADALEASSFASMLLKKAKCFQSRYYLASYDGATLNSRKMSSEVSDMCSAEGLDDLMAGMRKANQAAVDMMAQVSDFGACLYAAGSDARATSKVACVQSVMPALRVTTNGQPGLLVAAFDLLIAFTGAFDDLLKTARFGSALETLLGVGEYGSRGLVEKAAEMAREGGEGAGGLACTMLLADMQAFAATFEQVAAGLTVWMRTYARKTGSSCRSILNKMPNADGQIVKKGWLYGSTKAEDSGYCKPEYRTSVSFGHLEPCTGASGSLWTQV